MPAALRGTLFRNGAGRNDLGGHWFPHWFDGDGMISAIRFDDAGIHYFNRYVRTKNYLDETRAGRIVHRGFGKMRPGGVIGNALPPAGQCVQHFGRRRTTSGCCRCGKAARPMSLDPRTLETLGLEDFGGQVSAFSAHPKTDPRSGELFNFGIDYGRRTTLDALSPARRRAHALCADRRCPIR